MQKKIHTVDVVWIQASDDDASLQTYQVGARFELLIVHEAPLDSRYTQVGFNFRGIHKGHPMRGMGGKPKSDQK